MLWSEIQNENGTSFAHVTSHSPPNFQWLEFAARKIFTALQMSLLYHILKGYYLSAWRMHIPPYGPCWRRKLGHPWGYPPKWDKTCLRCGRTAFQNFTPIDKAPAEKSVTVHKKMKKSRSKLSIPPYTTHGGIKCLFCAHSTKDITDKNRLFRVKTVPALAFDM